MKTTAIYKKGISKDFFKNLLRRFKDEEIYLEDMKNNEYYKILASTHSSLIVGKKSCDDVYSNQEYLHFSNLDNVIISSNGKHIFLDNGENNYRVSSNILNLNDYLLQAN